MSTLVDLYQSIPEVSVAEAPAVQTQASTTRPSPREGFAEDQIRSLVQRVFFPGRPKPPHHVLFCPADETTYVAEVCVEVARGLSSQITGSVCVVEANRLNPELESVFWRKEEPVSGEPAGSLRSQCQPLAENLWLAPLQLLMDENCACPFPDVLARRLSDFRLEFDYTVWHGASPGRRSETALLGHLSDGVTLVIEANSTRRIAAQKAKEVLQSARAHLLGVVLSERTFPIPERIYRRL